MSVLLGLFFVLLSIAAGLDAWLRICPNVLSLLLTAVGVLYAWSALGVEAVGRRVLVAMAVCAVLVLFELVWRRVLGRAGIGMGDIKVLFALMLVSPVVAVVAFCAGALLLAVYCLVRGRSSAPMLPFLAGCFLLAYLVFAGYRLSL